jgi:hypothetical protein
MSAVTVIGLTMSVIIGGVRLKQRHDYFLSRARYHSDMEIACQKTRDALETAIGPFTSLIETAEQERSSGSPAWPSVSDSLLARVKVDVPRFREDLAREDQQIAYHSAMARKYRHAARYAWLPIEPDPPKPGRNW